MKLFALPLFVSLFALNTHASNTCEVNDIDMADGDSLPAYVSLSTQKARFKNKAEFVQALGAAHADFDYARCKNAMIWEDIRANGKTKVYTALRSVEDECDGGNSYGVLYFKNKIVGSINDSYITCK